MHPRYFSLQKLPTNISFLYLHGVIVRVFLRGVSTIHEKSPSMMLLSLKYELAESPGSSDDQLE